MAPLTECMKGNKFIWTNEVEATFRLMKERLTTAPILALPDFNHTFELHIDTSKLSGVQLNYNTYDVEFYAVLQHKAGVSNRVANALSRRSNLLVTLQVEVPGFDFFRDLFVTDPYFSEILLNVQAAKRIDFRMVSCSGETNTGMRKDVEKFVQRCRICRSPKEAQPMLASICHCQYFLSHGRALV
ncbi:uncharacterized protein LOC120282188 [Dioscorea cayenensis subsp. rotundata]|uniref:Uncharacterized protein LOC120282188 n=1 Tax=Dioscorea cayennensis subsp. rotundata TaxID=55577 RepID=A0AB40CYB9_DIOCR|nr:uncharacterized protein LOC120282188 [Dioscorea cayenensis subsp. rotundata]